MIARDPALTAHTETELRALRERARGTVRHVNAELHHRAQERKTRTRKHARETTPSGKR